MRGRHAEEGGSTGLYVAVAAAAAAGTVVKTVVDKFNDDESATDKFDRAFEILDHRFMSLPDSTDAHVKSLAKVKEWVQHKEREHPNAAEEPIEPWPIRGRHGTGVRFQARSDVTRNLRVQSREGRRPRDAGSGGAAAAAA